MKNLKLQHLRFFVAVYEQKSVTAAASKVHATQSGVSMQIRDLEEILGVKLFERTSKGVVPTKAGERIYWRAARVLLEIGELELDVNDQADKLVGTVRAGIMPTFARSILAPVLIRFSRQNPLVDVKITEGYSAVLTQMVANDELDLAVVPGGEQPTGLRSTFLDTDVEILVSRPGQGGDKPRLETLATAPSMNLVLPGPENARRAKIDQYLENFCQSAHTVMELDSMITTLDMIERGDWNSVLPGCLCLPNLGDPNYDLIPVTEPDLRVDYLLIEPAARASSKPVQMFEQELSQEIRQGCQACRDHFGL
ncbi:LysR family transcriptional regulator [Falsiphaeobacter marinintestinus]|uniref:LysR family transcriptional regulator n=1 Tax=Falsiphaeobacter marinintestinus TaxID=1492905 RepID=UPI0011B6D886|nr:LysR family transcriptional regulator [Phaeobacter marinintestinus]